MIASKGESLVKWLLLLLALVPALAYAWLGTYSRLASDWLVILYGKALDPWANIVYWRSYGSGSYSFFALHSLVAPAFDERIAPLTPPLLVCLWTLGMAWLIASVLPRIGCQHDRRKIALGISALAAAASLQALYHPQAFYWYSASTRYILPLALLAVYLGLALRAARHGESPRGLSLLALAGAGICFAAAGLSELHAIFQWVLLSCLIVFAILSTRRALRRDLVAMLGAGWAASSASLAIQVSAPATQLRMTENSAGGVWHPIRELSRLVNSTALATFDKLGDQTLFASFMLLLAVGIALGIGAYKARGSAGQAADFRLKAGPLWLTLLTQLCLAPILWMHTSDHALLLGRYSYSFALALAANAALTAALALLLWQRDAAADFLRSRKLDGQFLAVAALLLVIALFAPTQLRDMHFKAATFCALSALSVIMALCWQLMPAGETGRLRRFGGFALAWQLMTILCAAALIGAMHYSQGAIQPRALAATAWMGALGGLLWGGFLGMLLRQHSDFGAGSAWLGRARNLALCLGFALWLGLLSRQAAALPALRAFAAEWDARHARMLQWRENDPANAAVPQLSMDIAEFFCCSNRTSAANANYYYGFTEFRIGVDRQR